MQGVFTYIGTFGGRKMSIGSSGSYTYGFNGQVKDNEVYGEGNAYDFGARIYDPRLGRWFAVDPLADKYANLSPYNFSGNSPVICKDPDGKRIIVYHEGKAYEYTPGVAPPAGSPDILFKVHEAATYAMQTKTGAMIWNAVGNSHRVIAIRFKDATHEDREPNKFVPYNVSGRSEKETKLGDLYWDFNTRIITKGGAYTINGQSNQSGYQSPSTVLLHDLGHVFLMDIALNMGLNSKEWKEYLMNNNKDFGYDSQYNLKEERTIIETIETPYINEINAIEGENGSYQRPRTNHEVDMNYKENNHDVNKNPSKSEQQQEFSVPY